MVINGKTTLFSDEEIVEIKNLWNPETAVIKNKDNDRLYSSNFVNNELSSNVVNRLIDWFNLNANDKVICSPENLILHHYKQGCFFSKHKDNQVRNNGLRKYLVGITLNRGFTGGEFFTYTPDKVRLGEKVGVPYLMSSEVLHEVMPVHTGIRKTAFIFIFEKHLQKKTIV